MNSKTTSRQSTRSTETPDRPASRSSSPSLEARRRLVAQSLSVDNPPNNARELPEVADPAFDCQLELAVDAIKPYERNPRRANNVKFDEIKESIRVCGIRNPLTVTRRPGDAHFIVEAGGNTRLAAIQQLWEETRDPGFQKMTVIFRPWQSESHVLTAHLIENEQRGELTFWDKAASAMALKEEIESEQGRALSMREFEEELKQRGMSANRSSLSQYQFATEKLSALGAALVGLSGLDVKLLQPRLNLIRRYAEKCAGIGGEDVCDAVLNRVFERHGDRYATAQSFNAEALCQDCEQALAEHLGVPAAQFKAGLDQLDQSPQPPHPAPDAKPTNSAATGPAVELPAIMPEPATSAPRVSSADTRTPAVQLAGANSAGRVAVAAVGGHPAPDLPDTTPDVAQAPSRRGVTRLALVEDVMQCVAHFARITGVGDCLNFGEAMPCGYFMEAPAAPLDLEPDRPLRHRAWWVLALMSGQMHEQVSRKLPAKSRWAQYYVQDDMSESELPLLIENELGGPPTLDAVLTDWLLDSTDEAAALLREIVVLVRELRKPASLRPAMANSSNPSARKR